MPIKEQSVLVVDGYHMFEMVCINARCFYHFSKNLRDNKKKVGAAYDMVERCIFPLHISTNDDMFTLLASAMIEEAREVSVEAERYLSNTLDTDRYGYPNIAITAQGLEGTQVVNNIVEALNSIMSKALDGESFDIGIFVREAVLIMRSVKKSSPQCFISRPTPVIMKEYHPEMRQKGTAIFDANGFKEKRGPLERTYSGISAPPVHRQSESAQHQGDPNLNDAGTSDMSSRSGRESIAETVVVAEQSDWESLSDSQAVRTCGDTHSESASRSRSDPVWECLSDLRVSQTEGTNAVTHMSPQPVSNSEVWESLSDLIEDTSMQPPPEQEPLRLPSDVHE
ncbi:hypothetical protein FOZ63_024967, partial [Perkinsus olseni]